MTTTIKRTCYCGAELPRRQGTRYCSDVCRATAQRVMRHNPTRTGGDYGQAQCGFLHCGATFTRRRPWSRFDSDYCRSMEYQRLHPRRRKKAAEVA